MSGAVLIGVQAGRVMPANSGQSLARRLLQHCQADLRRRLAIALAGHADLPTMRPAGDKSKRTSQSQRVSNNICRRIGKPGYPRDRPLLPKSGLPPFHRTDLEGRLLVESGPLDWALTPKSDVPGIYRSSDDLLLATNPALRKIYLLQ
jgi:hypothetical protein